MKLITIYFVGSWIQLNVPEEVIADLSRELQSMMERRHGPDGRSEVASIGNDIFFSTRHLIGYKITDQPADKQEQVLSLMRSVFKQCEDELNEGEEWKE